MRFVAIQSEEGARLLASVPPGSRLDAMHAVTPDGRVWTGGDAVPRILEALPGGRPLAVPAAAAPGLTRLLYRAVAGRRDRLGALLGQQACAVDPSRRDP
jgi:predicted DCC family thiol-disulfide oxidoreductase YuxK